MADAPTWPARETFPASLDLAHLSRQTGGDRLLQHELLELFSQRSAELVGRMRAMAEEPQPEKAALRDLAHQLKGSALSLGAFGVAAAAEDVESLFATPGSASPDKGAGKTALTALSAALALTLAEIEAHLRALP